MGRTSLLGAGLLAAASLPYLSSPNTGLRQWITSPSAEEQAEESKGAVIATPGGSGEQGHELYHPKLERPEGQPVNDLSEIFRFDISSGWVLARWPRVTTRLSTLDLNGYRVPLVTGTKENDLAGSLTYYFNQHQQVQRITFLGKTGDPTAFVALMTGRFQFVRELVPDPSLYVYKVKAGKQVVSEMRIRPVPTVSAADPRGRFEVARVIERPG
jgi:hypothetical protein